MKFFNDINEAFGKWFNGEHLRWVLKIPTVKRINNCGLNTSSSLATRHNPNNYFQP